MNITNVMSVRILGVTLLLCSATVYAEKNEINHKNSNVKAYEESVPYDPPVVHADHSSEHGGQINVSTEIETKWLKEDGQGAFHNQLEMWLGTDENKLFLQLNSEKPESERTKYETKLMYSRAFEEFWDIQVGLRHTYHPDHEENKSQTYFVVGLNGLAPYFFDTDINFYTGKDQQFLLNIETDRDVLLTQKLILQPYLHSDIVFRDHSKYAKKSGLSEIRAGSELRYEITKQVMPFIDIGYKYERGDKQTAWQDEESSEHGWVYGAGIQFLF